MAFSQARSAFFLRNAVEDFYWDWSSRSAVRIVVMDAENLFSGSHAGKHVHRLHPLDQSFFILFFLYVWLSLIFINIQI